MAAGITKAPAVHTTVCQATLTAKLCGQSFFDFVKEFWHVVVPEQPVWGWHIRFICDAFQADAERVFAGLPKYHDTVCNISPGSTKSTVLSVMAPAWCHARMPSCRVLTGSHTQQLTFDLARKSRMVETSPLYRAAWPHIQPSPDQWTKSLYMNTSGGGRMSCTVGGMSPTGFHAHIILVDDPLDPMQARSKTEADLATANSFMSEVLPSRKVDKAVTPTWLIMQRLHENDPSGHMLSRSTPTNPVRHICIPAELSARVRPVALRTHYKNNPDRLMDPVRLSKAVLDQARRDLGPFGYAGQYDQHPVPRGGGMFKTSQLQTRQPPPMSDRRWVAVCRFWDKAGTDGGGAYTAGLKMGRYRPEGAPKDGSEDQWWLLHCKRDQLDAGPREAFIVSTAKMDTKRVIVGIEQEPGSGGKESAQLTVRRLAGYRVKVLPATGTKVDRADAWAAMVNLGGFFIAPGDWCSDLLDELTKFPYGKYKDQVDAGSGAFIVCSNPPRKIGAI